MADFNYIRHALPEPVRYGPPVYTSTEPTVDGYSTLPEESVQRDRLQIIPGNALQLSVFKVIQRLDPFYLQPSGELYYNRQARGYPWVRRSSEGQSPKIMYIRNGPSVLFEVEFHTRETVQVHVPFESWDRATGTPEDMRASLQQAYLNFCRGVVHHSVIMKRDQSSLPVCDWMLGGKTRVVAVHQAAHRGGHQALEVVPLPREATMGSTHDTSQRFYPYTTKDSVDVYRQRKFDAEQVRLADRPFGYHLDPATNQSIRRWRSNTMHGRRDDAVVPLQSSRRDHRRHISHEDVSSSYTSSDPSSSSASSNTYYYYPDPYYGSSEDSSRTKYEIVRPTHRRSKSWWNRIF